MPDFIDPIVDRLPPGKVLYRYHCRYVLMLVFIVKLEVFKIVVEVRD
jgi:hypothetical protein